MSAATPPSTAPQHHAPPPAKKEPNEITIISHSGLYYWWPVWACGFLMAIITFAQGYVMGVVPRDSKAFPDGIAHKDAVDYTDPEQVTIKFPKRDKEGNVIKGDDGNPLIDTTNFTKGQAHVIVTEQGKDVKYDMPSSDGKVEQPHLHMSPSRLPGVVFVFVLLMVLFITNVPLRGMWSLLVIVVAVSLAVIFILLGWIETILTWLYLLDVRINVAGYMTISIFLLIIWLVALLVFDKQRYITFTPGQFKVCEQIGGGEQVYSTEGMTLQKQRSDFFRHYVLGLGSGDLVVRTAGAQAHHIDLPNVLFINAKVRQIEELIARKAVIETQG
jgi:hypothetical protein